MDKIIFTFCDEQFTLRDIIGAICACVIVIALFAIVGTLETQLP